MCLISNKQNNQSIAEYTRLLWIIASPFLTIISQGGIAVHRALGITGHLCLDTLTGNRRTDMSLSIASLRKQAQRVVEAADAADEIDGGQFTLKVARARMGKLPLPHLLIVA